MAEDVVEPDVDALHGQVQGDESGLEVGGHTGDVGVHDDIGDERSNPASINQEDDELGDEPAEVGPPEPGEDVD